MKKSRILALMLVISLMATFFAGFGAYAQETLPVYYDFSENELGSTPTEVDCKVEFGSAEVIEYGGKKCVFIQNDAEGKYAGVSKRFDAVSDCAVQIQFSYLQRYVRSNGATVFSLNDGSAKAIEIVTKDNNIVALASDGTQTVLVEKFSANKWYEFYIYADITTDRYDLIVNENKFYSLGFKTAVKKCDSVNFFTTFSPGFCVTQIGVTKDQPLQQVEVTGPDKLYVMHESESKYEYTALLRNVFGAEVKEAQFKFEIEPATEGITLETQGNKAIVEVSQDTSWRGVIGINVTATDGVNEISEKKYVNVLTQEVKEITFDGVRKVAYGINKDNTFTHKVVFKNSDGKEVDPEEVVWEHSCTDSRIEIATDGEVMYIKVKGELEDMDKFHVKATLKSNVKITAERDIYTYSQATYESDAYRLSVVEDSLDLLLNNYAVNPYNDAPLIPAFLDLNTMKPAVHKSKTYGDIVMSNFAQVTGIYRVLDSLAIITDNEDYTDTVNEAYQWYLDNGLDDNGTGYWGGHCCYDMKTLNRMITDGHNYHELKQHGMYLEPFFRLDEEKATNIVKGTWLSHVSNWETLMASRHGKYDSKNSDTPWYAAKDYKQLTSYIQTLDGIPFRPFCNDLMGMAATLYKETGDENGLLWSENLLSNFYNLRDPKTKMIPNLYITARGADGIIGDPDVIFPGWYTEPVRESQATITHYGDRLWNQWARDLVDQGFYPPSVLEKDDLTLIEAKQAQVNADHYLSDFALAETLGGEKGDEIKRMVTEHVASYTEHFWRKNSTRFDKGMIDGVNLSTFVVKRNGYMGSGYYGLNKQLGYSTINSGDFFSLICKCYSTAQQFGMTEEAKILKELVDFYSDYNYKIGILGNEEIGDEGTKLNFGTQCNKAKVLLAMLDFYESSKNEDFLTLARVIANNYISANYNYGLLSETDNSYASKVALPEPGEVSMYYVGGYNYVGYYALARLEAITCGVQYEIPEYEIYDGYYEDVFLDDYMDETVTTTDRDWFDSGLRVNADVLIKKILCDDVIKISVGESRKMGLKYYPFDYTEATGLVCENFAEDIVHYNQETASVEGISPGEAEITFYAGSNKVKKTVKIIVEQEENR